MADQKDSGWFAPSSGLSTPPPSSAQDDLAKFVAEVRQAIAADRPRGNLANNSVTVQPGGRTFSTIGDALNSITDASPKKRYVLYIGAGTYAEVVTCKSWVFLSGEDPDQTFIAAPASSKSTSAGTVIAASNAAIQNCTVQATEANVFAKLVAAVLCQNAVNFDVENCKLWATDTTGQWIVIPLCVATPGTPQSQVNVSYSTLTARGGGLPVALFANFGAYVHGMESTLVSYDGSGWGGISYSGSNLLVEGCTVEGVQYSLNVDEQSKCTANQCTLVGPVASGVVVNP